MLINTAVFGSLEVGEDMIFHMPEGPLGFPGGCDYALITKSEEDATLMWFQAVDTTIPCFVVFSPSDILDDYAPEIESRDLRALGCATEEDRQNLVYLVIAVVPEDITKTTVNLKSPIVINKRLGIARQVILSNTDYPIQFPLVPAPAEEEKLSAIG